jgi:hypothetical protein
MLRVRVRRTVHSCSGRTRTSLCCDGQIPTSLRTSPEQNIEQVLLRCSVRSAVHTVLFGVLLQVWKGLNTASLAAQTAVKTLH